MEFSEDIENAICIWFEKALNITVPSFSVLGSGTIMADILAYFDQSYFSNPLENIYRDFSADDCSESQEYHLSIANWKLIVNALDQYLLNKTKNEAGFEYDLEEEK